MGALSREEEQFLHAHQFKFHGFDPEHRDGNTPVFDAEYPSSHPEKRIEAYADGRVITSELKKEPFVLKLP